uniref:MORN repeat protein n=1 Tax=Salinispora arenicola (strain CNS-205) TaxID=391037 RepID=A8LW38_SALAI
MSDDRESPPLRVPDELLDYDRELFYTYNGKGFTGIGYADVPGHGLSEISYVDGAQEGPSRDWYPSGQLKGESNYKANMLHGDMRDFRDDGSLISEKLYDHSVLVRSVTYDSQGNVVDHYEISESSPAFSQLRRLREQGG